MRASDEYSEGSPISDVRPDKRRRFGVTLPELEFLQLARKFPSSDSHPCPVRVRFIVLEAKNKALFRAQRL